MMDLYRIGKTVLNLDRINGILDHHVTADPGAPDGQAVLRILFDQVHIDLTGKEAEAFRYWFRHVSRSLDPHRDEDGEELISPDMQVRRAFEILQGLIDRDRPRDRVMRLTAHRFGHIIDQFLTGELQPARAKDFERGFEEQHLGAHPIPGPSPAQS
jgi:hypothetical protein